MVISILSRRRFIMKLESISAITNMLAPVFSGSKSLLCLGAKHAESYLLEPFCLGTAPQLPFPQKIYDFFPDEYPDGVNGIPVLPLNDLKEIHSEDALILIAAEDQEFYNYLGELYDRLHCYYFPILPCTSIEAYFYALEHELEIEITSKLFSDALSQRLYREYWESRICGRVYDPLLFSEQPYWGNDLVPNIPDDDMIVLGGAYNGHHIDRAMKHISKVRAMLFEPNSTWAAYLKEKFCDLPEIRIIPKALYNSNGNISFDTSNELGAQVCLDGNGNCTVQSIRLDEFYLDDVGIIALDIEGAELQALEGAERTIKECRPILAICSYHKISDYIDIPQYIHKLGLAYDLYFRQHSCYYEESVVYAIPHKVDNVL